MELAKKRLKCPECKELMTGLIRRVACDSRPASWEELKETEWLCEECDETWVLIRGRGLIRLGDWEELVDEEESLEEWLFEEAEDDG